MATKEEVTEYINAQFETGEDSSIDVHYPIIPVGKVADLV